MIKRILKWFANERRWHREHLASWQGWTEPGPDGLSRFQRECENEVCNSLPAVGSGLQARSVEAMEGTQGSYIHARIQNSEFEFWLYTDTVCFTGPDVDWRAEEWDARTPDELIQRVLAQAIQLVLKAEVDCA